MTLTFQGLLKIIQKPYHEKWNCNFVLDGPPSLGYTMNLDPIEGLQHISRTCQKGQLLYPCNSYNLTHLVGSCLRDQQTTFSRNSYLKIFTLIVVKNGGVPHLTTSRSCSMFGKRKHRLTYYINDIVMHFYLVSQSIVFYAQQLFSNMFPNWFWPTKERSYTH